MGMAGGGPLLVGTDGEGVCDVVVVDVADGVDLVGGVGGGLF